MTTMHFRGRHAGPGTGAFLTQEFIHNCPVASIESALRSVRIHKAEHTSLPEQVPVPMQNTSHACRADYARRRAAAMRPAFRGSGVNACDNRQRKEGCD